MSRWGGQEPARPRTAKVRAGPLRPDYVPSEIRIRIWIMITLKELPIESVGVFSSFASHNFQDVKFDAYSTGM
jgi:hypothetical protein